MIHILFSVPCDAGLMSVPNHMTIVDRRKYDKNEALEGSGNTQVSNSDNDTLDDIHFDDAHVSLGDDGEGGGEGSGEGSGEKLTFTTSTNAPNQQPKATQTTEATPTTNQPDQPQSDGNIKYKIVQPAVSSTNKNIVWAIGITIASIFIIR